MPNNDLDAENYSKNSTPQVEKALKLLSQYPISDNSTVLHIGHRDGFLTSHLAQAHPTSTFHAVDSSPNMHAYAQEHHPLPNIHYHLSDINAFSPNTQFDRILCFSALYYILDQQALFKNLKSWLKPNGSITLLTYGYHEPYWLPAAHAVESHPTWSQSIPKDFQPHTFLPKANYLDLFKNNDLHPEFFEITPQTHPFESLDAFLDYVQGYHPHTKFVPSGEMQEFRSRTGDAFLKDFAPQAAPPYTLEFDLWEIHLKNS